MSSTWNLYLEVTAPVLWREAASDGVKLSGVTKIQLTKILSISMGQYLCTVDAEASSLIHHRSFMAGKATCAEKQMSLEQVRLAKKYSKCFYAY